MHKTYILLFAGALSLCIYGCRSNQDNELSHHHNHSHATEHQHEKGHEHGLHDEDLDETGSNEATPDDGEISLSQAAAERFGVATETIHPSTFYDVLKVSGVIAPSPSEEAIIAAPTSGIITFTKGIDRGAKVAAGSTIAIVKSSGISGGDQNKAAKAAYDAAKRELDRLTPLYEDRLVTASEYNAALKAFEEANATYSARAAAGMISSPINGVLTSIDATQGQYIETGMAVATVSASSKLTLRADVPEKYYGRISSFVDATIGLPYSNHTLTLSDVNGHRIASGEAARTSTPGYVPVYFTFDNDGNILPGSNVEVYLKGKELDNVISVPLTALSEQQGQLYVFIKLDEDCYRKVPVKTGMSDGKRIEILSGIKSGDNVVVAGTTTVRIAESSGVVPEGHSHNH